MPRLAFLIACLAAAPAVSAPIPPASPPASTPAGSALLMSAPPVVVAQSLPSEAMTSAAGLGWAILAIRL